MNKINPLNVLGLLCVALLIALFYTYQMETALAKNSQDMGAFIHKATAVKQLQRQWESDDTKSKMQSIVAPLGTKAILHDTPQTLTAKMTALTKLEANETAKKILNEALHVKKLTITRESPTSITLFVEMEQ